MNKNLLTFFSVACMSLHAMTYAQQQPGRSQVFDSSAQWTWMAGPNAITQFATYGTQYVPAATNNPGARLSPACWTDKFGTPWMFGGGGYGPASQNGMLSDMWRFDIALSQWVWMSGAGTGTVINIPGVYGTKGVPAKTNRPGGRRNPAFWTDTAGNFWLFGGDGYASTTATGKLNDLWKYNPTDSTWTWVSGSSTVNPLAVYGTKGVTDPAGLSVPGGRGYSNPGIWVDKNNNFWVFGGFGVATNTTVGPMADLWKYDPVADRWTWMSGTTGINQAGLYSSSPGQASTSIYPGSRGGPMSWIDGGGNLWLFGGNGYTSSTTGGERLSDLWKYNPATGEWTWVGGSNINGTTNLGNYGTRNVTASANWPGGRSQPGAMWTDVQGNFYFVGGYGYPASGATGFLNDIWKFNPTTQLWTWIDGVNTITKNSIYGTKGAQSPLNDLGATSQGGQWIDNSGNLWHFGGSGLGATGTSPNIISDMWRYSPPPCNVTITASRPLTLCIGDSVILKANTPATGSITYQWYESATPVGTDTAYVAKTAGSYTVKIISSACNNTSSPSVVVVNPLPAVSINLSPATATICTGKDTALTASGAVSYTWTPSTFTGSGATIRANPTTTTTYTVQGTGANGCIGVASRVVTVNSLPTITVTPAIAVVCNGKDTALTAGGGISYTWTPATYTGSGATIRTNPTATTTYTVTGTDANGCQNTATRAVTVNSLPTITITPTTAVICKGKDTALTGGGGVSYTWSPSTYTGSGATIRANATTTTTYTVTGTDANGCKNTATRAVTVNNNPTVVINPSTAAICNGKDTGFAASGATTYSWTPASGLNGTNTAAVRANPTTTTSYIVTGTDGNGCMGMDTQNVVVKQLPPALVTPAGPVAFCERDSILLTASYTPGANSTYQWKNGITIVGNGTEKHMANAAGNYTVTVKDTASCSATSAVVIVSMNTRPLVTLTLSGPTEFCEGNTVILRIPQDTGITYQWMRGGVNVPYAGVSFYQALESGIYKVIASRTNIFNCADTSLEVPVIVHPLPNPALYANGARLYTDNIYAAYQWFYMGQALLGQTSWEYTATQEGTYKVLVIDSNNCSNESINRTMVNLGMGKIGSLTDAITLYPNPTNGNVNISSPVDVSIQLYNMAGRELQYIEHAKVMDINTLPAGLYMARILDRDGVLIKVEKLIKQ